MPTGLRDLVPAKITSSMRAPRKTARRLLAEHPADGVAQVGFAASVGTDDGRDSAAVEAQFRAVAERLKSLEFDFSQLQQSGTSILTSPY